MEPFVHDSGAHVFTWDLVADDARLETKEGGKQVWRGSLLPFFWLRAEGEWHAVESSVDATAAASLREGTVVLRLGRFGSARLEVAVAGNALRFTALEITWVNGPVPEIHSWFFGARTLTAAQRVAVPTLDLPFWPTWRAEGFAVASAKTNPMQSFFRSWDFGHANIPLGSFGPAMGTPYAAAFPRPIYGACAGGRDGWICFGAGEVPDAALTFQVRARSGALEWRSREDLWGAPQEPVRRWENPLWITWADTAWAAYRDYFRLFPPRADLTPHRARSFWGTWGDFRLGQFAWRSAIDRAREMEADLICVDDPWEEFKGSCRPDPQRLPAFASDVAYAHQQQIGVGIWMPMGWIENPAAAGLTTDDLLLGRDGQPVRSNWAIDPHETAMAFFCLDPSTPGTQRYLRERTQRVMRDYHPALLKIDFGYGLPGPDACAPRDPAMRGERIAWAHAKLIADAAREIDPKVTILGYSIHPLWADLTDEISLDDLGDAGTHEASAHGQWSIWAALAADRGRALMGSSGYLWDADPELLLNSAILGAPGANLPRAGSDGQPLPAASLARRRALFRWFRRTLGWQPLWLDSSIGSLDAEPIVRNWGRLEVLAGQPQLTALALREPTPAALTAPQLRGLTWTGRWILIAQDDSSIFEARELALIPLKPGTLHLPRAARPRAVEVVWPCHSADHAEWSWKNGMLDLTVHDELITGPMLGFMLRG